MVETHHSDNQQQQNNKVARLDEGHTNVHTFVSSSTSTTAPTAPSDGFAIDGIEPFHQRCLYQHPPPPRPPPPPPTTTTITTNNNNANIATDDKVAENENAFFLAETATSTTLLPSSSSSSSSSSSTSTTATTSTTTETKAKAKAEAEAETEIESNNEIQRMHNLAQEQRRLIEEETRKSPLIDDRLPISCLSLDYQKDNPFVQKKIDDGLASKYSCFRRVRGDGNCFFRAFTFAIFEYFLNEAPWSTSASAELSRIHSALLSSKDNLVRLGFPAFAIEDFHDLVMEQFTLLVQTPVDCITSASLIASSDSSIPADPIALLQQANSQLLINFKEQSISDYIIAFMRFIVSGHLRENSAQFEPFITNGMSVPQFCESEVEPMGIESDHMHIIALSQAMGICVRIEYLDAQSDQRAYNSLDDKPPTVMLLYRPGHYDVLYQK